MLAKLLSAATKSLSRHSQINVLQNLRTFKPRCSRHDHTQVGSPSRSDGGYSHRYRKSPKPWEASRDSASMQTPVNTVNCQQMSTNTAQHYTKIATSQKKP